MNASSALVQTFERAGFTLARRTGKHPMWQCPCGHAKMPCPKTPGKGRSTLNTQAQITRTLRACSQQRSAA